jgi:hypoxanthine phosphoribosyltransferase
VAKLPKTRVIAPPPAVLAARAAASVLVTQDAVERAIDRQSVALTVELQDRNPFVLAVMHGGLPYAGALLRRFAFPCELGYLHVGRYGSAMQGGELVWHATPSYALEGRTVLIVDDILDRGDTLTALTAWAARSGAAEVLATVLVDKQVSVSRRFSTRFAALRCPDRYLFGCGMDFRGYWRNLPEIWALPRDFEDP